MTLSRLGMVILLCWLALLPVSPPHASQDPGPSVLRRLGPAGPGQSTHPSSETGWPGEILARSQSRAGWRLGAGSAPGVLPEPLEWRPASSSLVHGPAQCLDSPANQCRSAATRGPPHA